MKILITGCKGKLGTELQDIIRSGRAEIGEVSDVIKEYQNNIKLQQKDQNIHHLII